jgi:uncharacterized protein
MELQDQMKADLDKVYAKHASSLPWLRERTIFVTQHGSRCYGTSRPESDIDYKGIAIPPRAYFHGFASNFEQAESKHDPDCTIYDLRKFFQLASQCNPNIIEVLFTDAVDHVVTTPLAYKLFDNRNLFVTRKALHTFSGYSRAQMKRLLAHKRWLDNPPKAPPTRAEFGLPERTVIPKDQLMAAEGAIQKLYEKWTSLDVIVDKLDQAQKIELKADLTDLLASRRVVPEAIYHSAADRLGYDTNFIALLDRERAYRARHKEWTQYQTWLRERNPARAALEAAYGYDAKFAMHLVRLTKMCREIITLGKVIVKRPDADELLAVRNGAWPFDKLVEWSDQQDAELHKLVETSPLPWGPDQPRLEALCMEIVELALAGDRT